MKAAGPRRRESAPAFRPVTMLLLALVWCLGWAAPPCRAGSSPQIMGGQGVGGLRLGQTRTQVVALLGPPARSTPSPNDPGASLLDYPVRGVSVFLGSRGGVLGITLTSPRYRTPEGLAVGSTTEEVRAAYGTGLQRGAGQVVHPGRGLGFRFRGGRVESVFVFAREDERPLLGDRLIEPGVRVGQLRLGDPLSKVVGAWGRPARIEPLGSGGPRALHSYPEQAVSLVGVQGLIEGILVETGDFITPSGIKVGSSREEVLQALGSPGPGSGSERIQYPRAGIGFQLVGGRVSQIQVLYRRE